MNPFTIWAFGYSIVCQVELISLLKNEMIIDELKEIGEITDPRRRIFEVFQLADNKLFPVLGQISNRRAALRLLLNFVKNLPADRKQGVFNTLLDEIGYAYQEIIEALPEKERAEVPKMIG